MVVLKKHNDPGLSEANFHAKLSHSKQFLKHSPSDVSVILFTEEKIFPVTTPNKCSAVADMGDRFATIDMGRKVGQGAVPLFRGAGSPSNTMSPELRPISVPSGILIHPAVRPQQIWVENCGAVPLLGDLGPHLTQCGLDWGLPCLRAKWHLDPSSRLATTDIGRKVDSDKRQTGGCYM